MSYIYTYKKLVTSTPQDIYGPHETPKISGYKIVDFRPPKEDEIYVINTIGSKDHLTRITHSCCDFLADAPRYIVKKLATIPETLSYMITVNDVYGGPVEIPDGYRFVDFRKLRRGELFLPFYNTNSVDKCAGSSTSYPRIIVEKI